jgi:hypothetical protein
MNSISGPNNANQQSPMDATEPTITHQHTTDINGSPKYGEPTEPNLGIDDPSQLGSGSHADARAAKKGMKQPSKRTLMNRQADHMSAL